jgi:hypothetical protein
MQRWFLMALLLMLAACAPPTSVPPGQDGGIGGTGAPAE